MSTIWQRRQRDSQPDSSSESLLGEFLRDQWRIALETLSSIRSTLASEHTIPREGNRAKHSASHITRKINQKLDAQIQSLLDEACDASPSVDTIQQYCKRLSAIVHDASQELNSYQYGKTNKYRNVLSRALNEFRAAFNAWCNDGGIVHLDEERNPALEHEQESGPSEGTQSTVEPDASGGSLLGMCGGMDINLTFDERQEHTNESFMELLSQMNVETDEKRVTFMYEKMCQLASSAFWGFLVALCEEPFSFGIKVRKKQVDDLAARYVQLKEALRAACTAETTASRHSFVQAVCRALDELAMESGDSDVVKKFRETTLTQIRSFIFNQDDDQLFLLSLLEDLGPSNDIATVESIRELLMWRKLESPATFPLMQGEKETILSLLPKKRRKKASCVSDNEKLRQIVQHLNDQFHGGYPFRDVEFVRDAIQTQIVQSDEVVDSHDDTAQEGVPQALNALPTPSFGDHSQLERDEHLSSEQVQLPVPREIVLSPGARSDFEQKEGKTIALMVRSHRTQGGEIDKTYLEGLAGALNVTRERHSMPLLTPDDVQKLISERDAVPVSPMGTTCEQLLLESSRIEAVMSEPTVRGRFDAIDALTTDVHSVVAATGATLSEAEVRQGILFTLEHKLLTRLIRSSIKKLDPAAWIVMALVRNLYRNSHMPGMRRLIDYVRLNMQSWNDDGRSIPTLDAYIVVRQTHKDVSSAQAQHRKKLVHDLPDIGPLTTNGNAPHSDVDGTGAREPSVVQDQPKYVIVPTESTSLRDGGLESTTERPTFLDGAREIPSTTTVNVEVSPEILEISEVIDQQIVVTEIAPQTPSSVDSPQGVDDGTGGVVSAVNVSEQFHDTAPEMVAWVMEFRRRIQAQEESLRQALHDLTEGDHEMNELFGGFNSLADRVEDIQGSARQAALYCKNAMLNLRIVEAGGGRSIVVGDIDTLQSHLVTLEAFESLTQELRAQMEFVAEKKSSVARNKSVADARELLRLIQHPMMQLPASCVGDELPTSVAAADKQISALIQRLSQLQVDLEHLWETHTGVCPLDERSKGTLSAARLAAERVLESITLAPKPTSSEAQGETPSVSIEYEGQEILLNETQVRCLQFLTAQTLTKRNMRNCSWGHTATKLRTYWLSVFGEPAPSTEEITTALMDPSITTDLRDNNERMVTREMRQQKTILVVWRLQENDIFLPTFAAFDAMERQSAKLSGTHFESFQKLKDEERKQRDEFKAKLSKKKKKRKAE